MAADQRKEYLDLSYMEFNGFFYFALEWQIMRGVRFRHEGFFLDRATFVASCGRSPVHSPENPFIYVLIRASAQLSIRPNVRASVLPTYSD